MPVANASRIIVSPKRLNGPDSILVRDQLSLLRYTHDTYGLEDFCTFLVWILTKKEDKRNLGKTMHSRYVPFAFNRIQRDIVLKLGKKNLALKPRQVGLTTFFLICRILIPTLLNPGTNGILVSQNNEYAQKHFSMLRRAFRMFGAVTPNLNAEENDLCLALHENLLHTKASNKKELILDQLDNFVMIGSAEVAEVGQGVTTHRGVLSELARWPGVPAETVANLSESIVPDGTLDGESTADGAAGYFYDEFMKAWNDPSLSAWTCHFHPWWWEDDYRIALTEKQKEELEADLKSEEQKLKAQFHLELEQVAFRRSKKLFLRHEFDEKYPEDPLTAFLLSGKGFFDKDILKLRYLELQSFKPYGQTSNGELVIFKKWIKGRTYVIGADPASGKTITSEDTDYSCAKVLDLVTGEEVAAYRARLAPQDFALDLNNLGRQFNNAIIAVERGTAADAGGDGGTVLLTLVHDCKYTNIYKHKEWIRRDKAQKTLIELEGLPMNQKTRPIACNRLKFFIENEPDKIWDKYLISECMHFVRNERGRPEAAEGNHDDSVLAASIAHYCRNVLLGYMSPEVSKSEKYGKTPQEFAQPEDTPS